MNANSRVAFSQLDAVLAELGFRKSVIPGDCVAYRHARTTDLIAVRLHEPSDPVPDYVMAAVRRQLDLQGVVDADHFDRMLLAAAA